MAAIAAFVNAPAAADAAEMVVGVAKVDITPEYPVRLNGFGFRREVSEGVTQRIWAKALAIGTDEEKPLVLVTIDSLGIRLPMVEEVARRLKEKAGIERQRLAVTFTHSHTTPKVNGASDTIFSTPIPPEHQAHIDRYTVELTDALEEVALAALADRRPARLAWAVGKVGFAKNRRTEGGPVDHRLPLLVVRSADDNSIRAIYTSYACHCVTLSNNKISGDWAGFAQTAMERKHPGAIALVSIGCGSDSDPDSGVTGDNIAAAAEQGAEIAEEVERLIGSELRPISGKISATLRSIELPLRTPPSREELAAAAAKDTPGGYNAKYQLAKLDRGEPLQTAIDYPIQTWSFGDSLTMVFLAGEVCVDYSLRLKKELDTERVWLHGYSNDFCCYIPSERLLREGGYGGGAEVVYFALPATLEAGLEEKIITEVLRQAPRQFRRVNDATKRSQLTPPKPGEMLRSFQTSGDFVVELMAAEPLVIDPVAIDFGPDGRLWVVEMRDYTREPDETFDQRGRVKALTDRDGDGRFDEARVFYDGLRFPTDVKVWRAGVIVCDAPDVIYFEDTDEDGRADVRKTLLTGFATHNAQARVNSLRWGLDNWLYGACGLFGGEIRTASGQELALGSRDFRFRPETGEIEAVGGRTQQGRARDDWGNWFGCENGSLIEHYPLADYYLARNSHVAPPVMEVFVPAGSDPNQLFPIGEQVLFQLSGAPGRPTSACGLEIYRDELLGPAFRGNAFVAEPVNQLVHRRVLEPRGVTFRGVRADEEADREFLASTDNWFRPVQIRTGLDGCLWIVDMCRYVIEHPRFIPMETLAQVDPMAGRTAGRIYRVRPRGKTPRPLLRLDRLDTAGLVAALDSPNGPQRDLAHELLVHRNDLAAAPLLEELFANSERAAARLHAICVLDGLNSLSESIVVAALNDPHASVRRHAVRLSEASADESNEVAAACLALVDDSDPQVQLQLAYSLGEWRDARAAEALAALARRHRGDEFLMAAVLSSLNRDNAANFVEWVLASNEGRGLPDELRGAVILAATKLGDAKCIDKAFVALSRIDSESSTNTRIDAIADFLESLGERRRKFLDEREHASVVEELAASATEMVQNPAANEADVLAAIRFLGAAPGGDDELADVLAGLLGAQSAPAIQQAAATAIARFDARLAATTLLSAWEGCTPALRAHIFGLFVNRNELLPLLVDEIKAGRVSAAHFDAAQRQRLLTHADETVRAAAAGAFAGAIDANRKRVVESFAAVERMPASVDHGREVFRKHCASCHRLEAHGHVVGPDLSALTGRTVSYLLEALFDPNRAIDERYQTYIAVTDAGQTYSGILARENASSITLVEQDGKEHTILRNALEELRNSGISLMPEGIEKDLRSADVADLVAYVIAQSTSSTTAGN